MVPTNLEEFNKLASETDMITFLLGGADCNVCNAIKPRIADMLEKEFPLIKFIYIDLGDKRELAAALNIFTIPVLISYFGGNEFIRKVRNFSIYEVEDELRRPYSLFTE